VIVMQSCELAVSSLWWRIICE